MRVFTAVTTVMLVGAATATWADDVPLGTWNGFGVALSGNNTNRQPASLVVRKGPDPHVLWRGGTGELITAVFQVQNQNNQREIGNITLADGRLTFSFSDPNQGSTQTCTLLLQPKEGAYVGDCLNRRVTLTPPAPAAAKPAESTPAQAR
jgi:hypothetical protein